MNKKTNESLQQRIAEACAQIRDATGFEPGAEVATAKVIAMLGFDEYPAQNPGESSKAYARRCKRQSLAWLTPLEMLREKLLRECNVDLQATHRGAYRIIPPADQAPRAAKEGAREARRALKRALTRITHVDTEKLTHEQRVEREAAMLNTAARLSMMTGRTATATLDSVKEKKDVSAATAQQPSMRRGE